MTQREAALKELFEMDDSKWERLRWRMTKSENFAEIIAEAHTAGAKAGAEPKPRFPCGFAWVNVKPGTSRFARYAKALNTNARHLSSGWRADSYYGGITLWVSDYGQNMQQKEAYTNAYAEVLRRHGIAATSNSRMD
jgi:hypothetical protein